MNRRNSTSSATPATLISLCLGADEDRRFRHLAWGCSVCALFVAAGIAGLTIPSPPPVTPLPAPPKTLVPVEFKPLTAGGGMTQPAIALDTTAPNPRRETVPPPAVTTVAIPDQRINAVPAEKILRPMPPGALTSSAAAAPGSPTASRYQPRGDTPQTPQPAYPALALRRGYQGTVAVEFTVTGAGQITNVRLRNSSGYTVLDEAALETVRDRWQFPPGPVRHHFVEIVFELK